MNDDCRLSPELALPLTTLRPDAAGWAHAAQQLHDEGARLLSLWGEPAAQGACVVSALWWAADRLVLAQLELGADGLYPGLHAWWPVAERLQRALRDLLGPAAQGIDPRPWLRHQAWSRDWHPLRADAGPLREAGQAEPYAYVEVQGQGVHEINVGPVHAGIIEPGQFRFSLLGEQVLRLEQRLGWTHKGVARLFRGRDAGAAVR
ncbi:MAG: NADH-quinone oxidoreductase subunit C, partial [Betaproteobacteria bacterium]|nr:NADH-quinone oxidoreductase subunit C [Betaproteobacteria bacterium]